jgi:glyoxylase-like metal-dependent hydrolase (beta-lactamase superfamily II)
VLQIYTIPVTPFAQNARVLFDSASQSAAIVDPGGDLDQIWSVVEQLQPQQLFIVLTHAHIDHAGATADCLARAKASFGTGVRLLAHADGVLRGTISRQAMFYGLPAAEYRDAPEPDQVLGDGDQMRLGTYSAKVMWTPGHAPDHLALYFDVEQVELHEGSRALTAQAPIVIAGDALFAGSIGRTDLPGGNMKLLLQSIHDKLLTLPENTIVLSGHGPMTTIGQEKLSNPFLQE